MSNSISNLLIDGRAPPPGRRFSRRGREDRISKFDMLLDMAVSSILYQTPNNRPTGGHHSHH